MTEDIASVRSTCTGRSLAWSLATHAKASTKTATSSTAATRNLRIAGRAQFDNMQNQGLRSNNTSGYRGVSWKKETGRWQASTQADGHRHYFGCFDTPEQADAVVKAFRAERMPFSEDAALAQPPP